MQHAIIYEPGSETIRLRSENYCLAHKNGNNQWQVFEMDAANKPYRNIVNAAIAEVGLTAPGSNLAIAIYDLLKFDEALTDEIFAGLTNDARLEYFN